MKQFQSACSICNHPDTIHRKTTEFNNHTIENGHLVKIWGKVFLYYCQECFEEYGGNDQLLKDSNAG